MFKHLMAGAAAAALMVSSVLAGDEKSESRLTIGDPAPKLADVTWIKGEPVSEYIPGQIYVLDFWATWCGPCKAAIPHMNEIHNTYKKDGVNVIGVAIWPRETMVPTKDYVEQKGDAMAYRIAEDNAAGAASKTFMEAMGQNGIPTVMIVDKAGKLAWVGHPAGGMDDALKQIMAGTFDLSAAREQHQNEVRRTSKAASIQGDFRAAMKEKDWATAIRAMDELLKLDPEKYETAAFTKYRVLLVEMGDKKAAGAWGRHMLEGSMGRSPGLMNQLAWFICDDKKLNDADRDAELALAAAQKANEVTGDKDPAILDTLAHAYFLSGNSGEAVRTQRRAVELAPDGEMKDDLRKSLEKFEKAAGKS